MGEHLDDNAQDAKNDDILTRSIRRALSGSQATLVLLGVRRDFPAGLAARVVILKVTVTVE